MTKLEMAIFIADTLFGRHLSGDPSVEKTNWKVKSLISFSKSHLKDSYNLAEKVRRETANSKDLELKTHKGTRTVF